MSLPSSLLKFRPVLTLEQVRFIVASVDTENEMGQQARRVLVPLLAKIEVGAISPSYKLSETHARKQVEVSERKRYEDGLMDAEEETEYENKILGV